MPKCLSFFLINVPIYPVYRVLRLCAFIIKKITEIVIYNIIIRAVIRGF